MPALQTPNPSTSHKRDSNCRGFVPQPKRWRGEQPHGILRLQRYLVRDYEHRPSSSASRVYGAMPHVRRLTDANAPTWRETRAGAG